MIYAVNKSNFSLFKSELESYFKIRYEIFIKDRGWSELDKGDGIEKDQFDTNDATYILGIENGKIYGGSRLISSDKPHLMSEVFPHLADGRPIPRDPGVWEWTRVFVTRDKREGRNSGRPVGTIICAMLEHCLDQGVNALSGVIDAWWLPRFHDMGWCVEPLGLPQMAGNDLAIAVVMPISHAVLDSTRDFHGIAGRMLQRPEQPAATQIPQGPI